MNEQEPVPPPGAGKSDPYVKDVDAIAFAMERLQTYLYWIGEHHASFLDARDSDSKTAEEELDSLTQSIEKAGPHLDRLIDLLLAGYSIDPNKQIPKSLTVIRRRYKD